MRVCHPDGFRSHDVGRYLEKFHGFVLEEPPQAIRSGHDTAVWRLATRAGAYIAKIFAAGRFAAVRAEMDLLDYLSDSGIRVPEALKNGRGQRIGLIGRHLLPAFWKGACPIVVAPLEDGRQVHPQTVTRQELTLAARCIGLMHEALQAYPGRPNVRRMEYWGGHLGRFEDLLGSLNMQSFASDELARWSEIDRRMEEAVGGVRRLPVTESVLHGDLGLDHIRFPRAQARSPADVYFFDFSDFSCGPVVFDLAVMLSRLYWESDVSLERWEQLRAWLLEGYESGFMLSGNDRSAIDDALVERLLIEIRYLNRTSLNMRAPYCPDGVRKRYQLAAHLFECRADRVPGRIDSVAS